MRRLNQIATRGMTGNLSAIASILGAVSIWGSTFAVSKMAMQEIGPINLSVMRFLLASAITGAMAIRANPRRDWRKVPWKVLALLGASGGTLFFLFQNVGMYLTSASSASLIQATIPVFTFGLSYFFLKERGDWRRLAGTVLSVVGVAVIVTMAGGATFGDNSLLGDLLMLGSAATWGVYTVVAKKASRNMDDSVISAGTALFGLLFMLPFLPMETGPSRWVSGVSARALMATAYLGVMGSGVAYALWNKGLKTIPASQAGIYVNLSPVIAVVFARALLGEAITLAHVLGGGMVILGAAMTTRQTP